VTFSALIRRFAFPERPLPFRDIIATVVCVSAAWAVRILLEPVLQGGLIWAMFWPALVIATVWAGGRAAVMTVALSIVTAWFAILPLSKLGLNQKFVSVSVFLVMGSLIGAILTVLRGALGELQAAESAREESELRFRLIADSAPIMLWMSDANNGGLYLNRAFREFATDEMPDVVSREGWRQVVHPDDQDALRIAMAAGVRGTEAFAVEARSLRKDGAFRLVRSVIQPRYGADQDFLGVIGVATDITESRKAEDALRESEARFRAMADSSGAPIWVTNAAGAIEFGNRAMADFFGMDAESLTGEIWQSRVHPEDLKRLAEQRAKARETNAPYAFEARFISIDKQWRWCEARCHPRFDATGAFLGYVGIAFDTTETKKAQADLKRINELLAERVEAALAEKEEAEAALFHAQKLEAVGRLTGGVAHDFNNLLTVVLGALEIIIKNPDDAEKRKRMAEAAMTAARRGERLTHQLLAFSRRQALRPEMCEIDGLLSESEPLLRRVLGEAIRFDIRQGSGAPVRIDVAQFEAALINLLVNAKDATPDGGAVTVVTDVRDVIDGEVPETGAGRYVVLSVSDTGEGMDETTLGRVFEPFFTTKPVGKGTGLGLSQVYGFARQSGGGVTVSSRLGKGATVTVYLPVSQGVEPERGLRFQPAARQDGAKLRVLLVEDDAAVAAIAETMLRDMGHAVVRAETGDQALTALQPPAVFDVLLTDVIMPGGMDGVALARRVTALQPDMEVLLTSGYAGDDVDSTLADAPWPLLRKPYSEHELSQILQTVRARPEPVL
jgi:PAS domain S-box-containing protein